MTARLLLAGFVCGLMLTVGHTAAQPEALTTLGAQVLVTSSNEHSTLDRQTRVLTSTVDVTLWNLGGRTVLAPLHAVVRTSATNVVVQGALGGPGDPRYHSYYHDCSDALGDGAFANGERVDLHLVFTRDVDTRFTYTVEPYGAIATNPPPRVTVAALQYTVPAGSNVEFAVGGADPQGERVTLAAAPGVSGFTFAATAGAPASGQARLATTNGQAGNYFVTFTATDPLGQQDMETVSLTIQPANAAPLLAAPDSVTGAEGTALTIPLSASDPDGDPLSLTAAPLPENAALLEASRLISFAPDYDQAGSYAIACQAFDGSRYSSSVVVNVTITDVALAADSNRLVLAVNPVESPSLLTETLVTGSVNADTNLPPREVPVSALITGLHPVNAGQGEAIAVALTGQGTPPFASHFAAGQSVAAFGDGIVVQSLDVWNATQAVAHIRVEAAAAPGPRSVRVQTGAETAWAIPSFHVTAGTVTIQGRVLDPDTGLPIAGALVAVEGTLLTTRTGADGSFTLTGVPAGPVTLVILPPNHEVIRLTFDAQPGAPVVIGDLTPAATVFDPAAPAGVSLMSVIGRGATEHRRRPNRTFAESDALVRDTFLLCGGTEVGMLDDLGNQLNPDVSGAGLLSFDPAGLSLLAQKVERNEESTALGDLLFACAWGIRWVDDNPPTLASWIAGLQDIVNRAWGDPRAPEHAIVLAIFNAGTSISPDPPTLTPDMRFNALQSLLFMNSFLTAAFSPEYTPGADAANLRALRAVGGGAATVVPSAPAALPVPAEDDPGSLAPRPYTQYWRGFFENKQQFCVGTDGRPSFAEASFAADLALMATYTMAMPSYIGVAVGVSMIGPTEGMVLDRMLGAYGSFAQAAHLPEPPASITARATNDANNHLSVEITFGPSSTHEIVPDLAYVYRLYRFQGPDRPREMLGELVLSDHSTVTMVSNGVPYLRALTDLDYGRDFRSQRWTLRDPEPLPMVTDDFGQPVRAANATWFYAMTVTRVKTEGEGGIPAETLYTLTAPWWNAVTVTDNRELIVAYQRRHNVQTGDYSDPILMRLDAQGEIVYDTYELEAGADAETLYLGEPMRAGDAARPGRIVEIGALGQGERQVLANTGFREPGHRGLAIDSAGRLYAENAASDALFGGRVFGYLSADGPYAGESLPEDMADLFGPLDTLSKGDRFFAGTVNYYSPMLSYARPTACGPIAIGPGTPASSNASPEGLYVVDEVEGDVKKIPVQALGWPSERRCGQPFADLPFAATGQDLEVRPDGSAELLVQGVPAPRLDASVDTLSRVAIGTPFEVEVTVANPSASLLADVRLSTFQMEGDGAAVVTALPSNAVVSLGAGQAHTFVYNCRSVESGDVRFLAQARGTLQPVGGDPVTLDSSLARSDTLTIGTTLEILDVGCSPRTVRPGETFVVSAVVHATGVGAVTGVVLRVIEKEPDAEPRGRAESVSGPDPASADVSREAGVLFTNTFRGVDQGWVRYGLEASGIDEASGERVTARHLGVDAVITPLAVAAWLDPERTEFRSNAVVIGTIAVTNLGDEAIYEVSPSFRWRFGNVGFRTIVTNSPVITMDPHSSAYFYFTFRDPVAPGTYGLDALVSAKNAAGDLLPSEEPTVRLSIGPSIRGHVSDVVQELSLDPAEDLPLVPLVEGAAPVSNVYVRVAGLVGDQYEAYTDVNGDFEIAVPEEGDYRVEGVHGASGLGFSRPCFATAGGGEVLRVLLPVSLVAEARKLADEHAHIVFKMAELPLALNVNLAELRKLNLPDAVTKNVEGVFTMPGVHDGVLALLRDRYQLGAETPRYRSIRNPDSTFGPNEWDVLVRLNAALALNLRRFKEDVGLNAAAVSTLASIFVALDQTSGAIQNAQDNHVFRKFTHPKLAEDNWGMWFGNPKWKQQASDSPRYAQANLVAKAVNAALGWFLPEKIYGVDAKKYVLFTTGLGQDLTKIIGSVMQCDFTGYMSDTVETGLNLLSMSVLMPIYKGRAEATMLATVARARSGRPADNATYEVLIELQEFDTRAREEVAGVAKLFSEVVKPAQDIANDSVGAVIEQLVEGQKQRHDYYTELIGNYDNIPPGLEKVWGNRAKEALDLAHTTEGVVEAGQKVGRVYQIVQAIKILLEAQVIQVGRNAVGAKHAMDRDPLFFQSLPASYLREYLMSDGLEKESP